MRLVSEQIAGGRAIDITEAPWQIGILSVDRKRYLCGGTIIADTWIITTKCCLTPKGNNEIIVHAGSTHKLEGGQFIEVAQSIPHPLCRLFDDYRLEICLMN